ncbi:MAG: mercuric reductase [Gemmatimonadota bacterium]
MSLPGPALLPDDEHDRALLALVHPADWVNPTPRKRYHLVVLGAGTGGLVTAAVAAGLGARVALIERHLMGGDCLNVGCVPSKAMIAAARSWEAARASHARFGGPEAEGTGDFSAVMARMRRIRAGLAPIDGARRFTELGVDVFLGHGSFTSADTIEVGGATLQFRRAVIATGARPRVPPIPGLAEAGYLTNESVFSLTALPATLAIVGGGPIGCELAQAFARFGSKVTLITDEGILAREGAHVAEIIAARLERDGVGIMARSTVAGVEQGDRGAVLTVAGAGGTSRIGAERILVAAGRTPNVDGMGLDRAGVDATPLGVTVDDRLRTTNPRVYAVGDVCTGERFTHVADAHARLVVQNALFFGRGKAGALVIPRCTYTDPEVAQVGLTAEGAATRGLAVDTIEVGLEHLDRSVLDGDAEGFLEVVLAKGSDRILGATLVAPHAGDSVGELTLAITNRLGLGAIGRTIHPYPTRGEVFRKAADQWRRRKLTPFVQSLFRRWFALLG